MSENGVIRAVIFKENIGIPNAIKENAARKNVLGPSKKAVLVDVKNTFYLKQTGQAGLAPKKKEILNETVSKELFPGNSKSVIKGSPNKCETVVAPQNLMNDDHDIDDHDQCHGCLTEDDMDILTMMDFDVFGLNEDTMKTFCFGPGRKSRFETEFDDDSPYKIKEPLCMSPPSMPSYYDIFSPFKLPANFYDYDITPIMPEDEDE